MKLKSVFKRVHTNPPPLAWAQLSHQKMRLLVAIIGVCFANVLMFTQLGLLAMLFDGTTIIHSSIAGDLVLISSYSRSLQFLRASFPRAYLYQAAAIEGVKTAAPLYLGRADWVDPKALATSDSTPQSDLFGNEVRILAFNPIQSVLNLGEVNQQLEKLTAPDTILFDRLSQSSLGNIPELLKQQGEVMTLMDNQRIYIVGLFELGSTLRDKGNVVMSDWTYAKRYGANSLDRVSLGVLTLEPGSDRAAIQAKLRSSLPPEVSILTLKELVQKEEQFQASEPNGVVLRFGTIVGFVVGLIIIYQVLYSDINDHLSEYATLKAMGYSDLSLLSVVIQESIVLAILGFIPGFFGSIGIYHLLSSLTRIPLTMRFPVAIQVFALTLIMCGISGVLASSKLRSADPVDVF
ncbi:FtsX-like permease family protein [Pseudanabaenaceae cyanobacterium LEGE 13415]|nr:FtsX-like permease family protein [Pseudanabaenaceae cyanobacterium LEGE 13415]